MSKVIKLGNYKGIEFKFKLVEFLSDNGLFTAKKNN